MPVRVRRSFAAPFVLIVGCSSGSSNGASAEPPAPAVHVEATDAASSAPVDAYAVDVSAFSRMTPDAAPYVNPCAGPPSPGKPTCNPPHPQYLVGPVVALKVVGADVIATVGRGTNDLVQVGLTAQLVDGNGKPIAQGEGKIISVTAHTAQFRLRGSLQSVQRSKTVRIQLY